MNEIATFVERLQLESGLMSVQEYINKFRLASKNRERYVCTHRQYLMYIIRIKTYLSGVSLSQIGRMFNRDHATVIHAIKCINSMKETNDFVLKDIQREYDHMIHKINFESI